MPSTTLAAKKKKHSTQSRAAAPRRKVSAKQADCPSDDCPGDSAADPMDRLQMIAVAAYYRAEHRGFSDGDPLADWLGAEAEIDEMLGKSLH